MRMEVEPPRAESRACTLKRFGAQAWFLHVLRRACLRRSGSRLREARASAGVGRSRRQAEPSEAHPTTLV
jgi:hypothetical protein